MISVSAILSESVKSVGSVKGTCVNSPSSSAVVLITNPCVVKQRSAFSSGAAVVVSNAPLAVGVGSADAVGSAEHPDSGKAARTAAAAAQKIDLNFTDTLSSFFQNV